MLSGCRVLAPKLCAGWSGSFDASSCRKGRLGACRPKVAHRAIAINIPTQCQPVLHLNNLPVLTKNLNISALKCSIQHLLGAVVVLGYLHGPNLPSATIPATPYGPLDPSARGLFPRYFSVFIRCPHTTCLAPGESQCLAPPLGDKGLCVEARSFTPVTLEPMPSLWVAPEVEGTINLIGGGSGTRETEVG